MEVKNIVNMNGGTGEMSYAQNSAFQNALQSIAKPIVKDATLDLCRTTNIPECFCIAELGCSSGPNALFMVSEIINTVSERCLHLGLPSPEFLVPEGLNASDNTSLNKGRVYISKASPPSVFQAYLAQFQSDFSQFLKSRSKEIVIGGHMVLTFMCRKTADASNEESSYMWDLLTLSLNDLVSEGLIEEEKVDSFNAPYFAPSLEEINMEIQKEESFSLDCMKMIETDWDTIDGYSTGQEKAKPLRAALETMLVNHFGEEIMDQLFEKMGKIAESMKRPKFTDVVISMIRLG
ncbi:hypothetical protein HHK36_008547 [Tetracentron sinense]|uniref:Uncharacterized protein n=1 Tax=Tetracentron sinense TaxID=13715 RepID=A0A834ZFR1_TETSI|nr:hypothetical protein HHK36_008547 [Tetracentron sinense]